MKSPESVDGAPGPECPKCQEGIPHIHRDGHYNPAWAKVYSEHRGEFWGAPDKATSAMYACRYGYDAARADGALGALQGAAQGLIEAVEQAADESEYMHDYVRTAVSRLRTVLASGVERKSESVEGRWGRANAWVRHHEESL